MPEMKSSIMSMASEMSRSERLDSLQGKDCFPFRAKPYWLFQYAPVRQIDASFQNFAEAHFEASHIEQRKGVSRGRNPPSDRYPIPP
jgi:hypothetical protein